MKLTLIKSDNPKWDWECYDDKGIFLSYLSPAKSEKQERLLEKWVEDKKKKIIPQQ